MIIGEVEDMAVRVLSAMPRESLEAAKQRLVNLRERASLLGNKKDHKAVQAQLEDLNRTGMVSGLHISSPVLKAGRCEHKPN
jgi:hypothetical protein